jgi:predicted ATP-grasp superfamily ATP-dependent carboligase
MGEGVDEVLIVGASTRAMAQSAAAAGFRVQALDAYRDRDLVACAATVALSGDLQRRWSAAAAARAAADFETAAVAYVSNFENHPAAVEQLARGRRLWGNSPATLREARDPFQVAAILAERGIPAPAVSAVPAEGHGQRAWLLKPRCSGGGHGIRRWQPGKPVPRSRYLQEHIDGIPGSVTFVADGRRAVPLGLSLQLVGEQALGVTGFRYCGSLLCGGPSLFDRETDLCDAAQALAETLTERFSLLGVNGLDFVARGGVPWPVEINPRYSASMELVEREHGTSIFGLHVEACRGSLPARTPYCRRLDHVAGKAIVYARETGIVEPSSTWESGALADIPHPGEWIARGRPICTVFATGSSAHDCRNALASRAAAVYSAISGRSRSVA